MCEKCVDLDEQIERCQRLAAQVGDALTVEAIKELLANFLAEKLRLHPEPE